MRREEDNVELYVKQIEWTKWNGFIWLRIGRSNGKYQKKILFIATTVIKMKVQICKKGNEEHRNTDNEQDENIWARNQEKRKKEELCGTERVAGFSVRFYDV